MESEIEKMYENIGINLEQKCCNNACEADKNPYQGWCKECKYLRINYPLFTAEKQLAILIALVNYNLYEEDKRLMIDSFNREIYIGFYRDIDLIANATDKEFSKCVAKLINNLWQDLTDAEKAQIKNILESEVRE